jgi:general secretion pathway protein M
MTVQTKSGLTCLGAWGAALLLPALLMLSVALPWWQNNQQLTERLERDRDQLQRYSQMVATLPALRAELERERANDDFKAFYFDAETPGLAGAQLQSEVQEMVRGAGARPISTQILPVDPKEQPPRVRVRVQLQGSTPQLLDVLYQIEDARPFLFIDQVSVRSSARQEPVAARRNTRRLRSSAQAGELTVRLDVFGYTLGTGPAVTSESAANE